MIRNLNKPLPDNSSRMPSTSTFARLLKYGLVKAGLLVLTVCIGLYLAVVVINYGGYIDQIFRADIDDALRGYFMSNDTSMLSPDEQTQLYEKMQWEMEENLGLHQPFLLRSLRWFYQEITFNWGKANGMETQKDDSRDIRKIVLEALPNTLLLAGTANAFVFLASVVTALYLSKHFGGLWDRLILALSPLSAVPNWIYAVLLIVIFASQLHLLPYGGMYDAFPPATKLGYIPIVAKHMLLPFLAIILSTFFQGVYTWRTYFLIHQGEDYVEMALAMGLPGRTIDTQYILRPVLPFLITNFTFLLIGFWQGVIVLEKIFNWPGIGKLFITAVPIYERGVVLALIVIFALLLAVSVFLLDIFYALFDPRIRITGEGQTVMPVRRRRVFARLRDNLQNLGKPSKLVVSKPESVRNNFISQKEAKSSRLDRLESRKARSRRLHDFFREISRYPLAVAGILIIFLMIGVSIYTVFALPYPEAVYLWQANRPEGRILPENARPTWINFFRRKDLPPNIILSSQDGSAIKKVIPGEQGIKKITLIYTFKYPYGDFPQDLMLDFRSQFSAKRPFVSVMWKTPDGRKFDLGNFSLQPLQSYVLSQDAPKEILDPQKNQQKFSVGGQGGYPPVEVLFANPNFEQPTSVPGRYILQIDGLVFEDGADLDADMVLYGKVYGWAGTDAMRRDLKVALLWGAPIALAFGFLGAIGTTLTSMMLAAAGVWFGGRVDQVIQRIADINMIIPVLPVAIMVFYLYSKSIWVVLAVVVVLNIFSSAIKNYRAAFLEMKDAPYIEAARAYGSSNWRMIFRYMIPRILPLLIPQVIILIPTYVCFEATLAFLNVSEPNMPTWGKVIYEAVQKGAFQGNLYWVLEPVGLIVLTGLSFAMVGFALDSIFNPRLRKV
jgi:peptide/nickel transport system permease protein